MLFWGYQSGGDAMALMARYSLVKIAKRFKLITLTVLAGSSAWLPDWRLEFQPMVNASSC